MGGQSKGDAKQEAWLNKISQALEDSSAQSDQRATRVLEKLPDYPNIPRKRAKLINFLKSSLNVCDQAVCEAVWNFLENAKEKSASPSEEKGGEKEAVGGGGEQNGIKENEVVAPDPMASDIDSFLKEIRNQTDEEKGNNGGKERGNKTKKVGEEEGEDKTKKVGDLEEGKSRIKKNKAKEKTETEVVAASVEEPVVKNAETAGVQKETLKEKKIDEPTAVDEKTDGKEDPKVISEGEASENVSAPKEKKKKKKKKKKPGGGGGKKKKKKKKKK